MFGFPPWFTRVWKAEKVKLLGMVALPKNSYQKAGLRSEGYCQLFWLWRLYVYKSDLLEREGGKGWVMFDRGSRSAGWDIQLDNIVVGSRRNSVEESGREKWFDAHREYAL